MKYGTVFVFKLKTNDCFKGNKIEEFSKETMRTLHNGKGQTVSI